MEASPRSRFHGAKFRRQVPFDRYVVDFYCHAAKLVVELDGRHPLKAGGLAAAVSRSRDAHFLLGLQKAGVRFVAADMPEANELVVGIMAVIAQTERKMISTRTKAALAEARKRVTVTGQRENPEIKRLGCPTGAAHLQGQGFNDLAVQALKANADDRAAGLASTIDALRAEGITSANGLAGALNARGYATPRGGRWTARSVLNVTARLP